MSITLHLKPIIEAELTARARAVGMTLEEYVLAIVKKESERLPESEVPAELPRADAVRGMLEFGERYHLSLGEPITREFLREGHRF